MSLNLNKVTIAGNLTRDPELKVTPSGTKICNFSVATNKTWKTKEGEKKEKVEFHNVVCFDKQAEVISQYFTKGKPIYLEGELQTSSWEDKDTQKKMYKTEIFLQSFQFNGDGAGRKPKPDDDDHFKDTTPISDKFDVVEYPEEDINPEDIPF